MDAKHGSLPTMQQAAQAMAVLLYCMRVRGDNGGIKWEGE